MMPSRSRGPRVHRWANWRRAFASPKSVIVVGTVVAVVNFAEAGYLITNR